MTTFLYEPIISGHNPTFALWVSRVARANGEETVLYLPDGVLKSETMKLNVDLARAAGVEIRSAGVEGETYDDAGDESARNGTRHNERRNRVIGSSFPPST